MVSGYSPRYRYVADSSWSAYFVDVPVLVQPGGLGDRALAHLVLETVLHRPPAPRSTAPRGVDPPHPRGAHMACSNAPPVTLPVAQLGVWYSGPWSAQRYMVGIRGCVYTRRMTVRSSPRSEVEPPPRAVTPPW